MTLILEDRLQAAGLDADAARVEADDADPDGQSLLIWYPAATPRSDYVRAAIKIEAGAKAAIVPNSEVPIKPYVDDDLPGLDLTVPTVRTVDPERTFWDKVVILHGLRRWFDTHGELRGGGQRVSRHYYDLHQLASAPVGAAAIAQPTLGADCRRSRPHVLQSTGLRSRQRCVWLLRARSAPRDDRAVARRLQGHARHDLRRPAGLRGPAR